MHMIQTRGLTRHFQVKREVVAASVLVLSFVGPLTISGAPAAMIATLLLMNLVAAAVVVGLLTTLARRK